MLSAADRPERIADRYISSACSASSSTTSSSTGCAPRRAGRSVFQSGMANPRNARERGHELLPAVPLALEHPPSLWSDAVEALPALPRLLDPASLDEAPLLQLVEHRVKRSDVELQHPAGAHLDQLADLVSVPRAILDEGEHQQLRTPLLDVPVHICAFHMCITYIYDAHCVKPLR